MKIGPFGPFEIAIILIVILVIFGPKNLPKLGSALGKAVKNLREGMGGSKKSEQAAETKTAAASDDDIEVEVIDKPAPGTAKPEPKSAKDEEPKEA